MAGLACADTVGRDTTRRIHVHTPGRDAAARSLDLLRIRANDIACDIDCACGSINRARQPMSRRHNQGREGGSHKQARRPTPPSLQRQDKASQILEKSCKGMQVL